MNELITVNVPQMQRDLQRAGEDNERLHAFLKQLNINEVNTPLNSLYDETMKLSAKEAEDADFNRALARRQARLDLTNDSNETLAIDLELKSANDRIMQLERQLLDAEETICHLKAEKLAAMREIERLNFEKTTITKENGNIPQCEIVLELEMKLEEQKKTHALEQEQRMAVIRDRESELKTLRGQLEDTLKQFKEIQQKYIDLVELNKQESMKQDQDSNDKNKVSMYGNDDAEAEASALPKDICTGRSRAPADADAVNPKWHEVLVRHPTPHFDMKSPEVSYILEAWTNNIKKIRYLRRWLVEVVDTKGPLPNDFPMAVELPRLPPEVRDGFLTLIVPLLRKQTEREILAHFRQYNDGIHSDLRIRVVPRQ